MAAKTNVFRVTCAGLTYRLPGEENPTGFALLGHHVELDAAESDRLAALDAVVPEGAPDPVAVLPVSGNPDNPYGGFALKSMEQHAADAAASAVQEPGDGEPVEELVQEPAA